MFLESKTALFSDEPREKKHNNLDNAEREDILQHLFSLDNDIQSEYLSSSKNAAFWRSIKTKFDTSLKAFRGPPPNEVPGDYILNLEKKAGRNWRFDYLARTNWAEDKSGLKLEFKRGKSIFDQPQFLQLYAKSGIVIRKDLLSYPEYLYEFYGDKLAAISNLTLPPKALYLKYVFGTNYKAASFFEALYMESKGPKLAALRRVQYESIDKYLEWVSGHDQFVDTSALQVELAGQLEKLFVSWDTKNQKFVIENFSYDDITLSGVTRIKSGRNGRNVIVLENLAGNEIEALLRWKNNPCVLGPAWQISLKVSARSQ